MSANAEMAFDCSSYEEYSRLYDRYLNVKKKEETPMAYMVDIQFPDGEVKSFYTSVMTIADMNKLREDGAVVLGYHHEAI